jgi:hypothetical protein
MTEEGRAWWTGGTPMSNDLLHALRPDLGVPERLRPFVQAFSKPGTVLRSRPNYFALTEGEYAVL